MKIGCNLTTCKNSGGLPLPRANATSDVVPVRCEIGDFGTCSCLLAKRYRCDAFLCPKYWKWLCFVTLQEKLLLGFKSVCIHELKGFACWLWLLACCFWYESACNHSQLVLSCMQFLMLYVTVGTISCGQGQIDTVQAPDTRYCRPQLYRYRYRYWAVQIFCSEKQFCTGYRCVQVIYVCRVYARKYGIGLKLQACIATVLTVKTGKRTTGLLVLAPILK